MLLASLKHFSLMEEKPEAPGGGTKALYLKHRGKTHCQWGKNQTLSHEETFSSQKGGKGK